MIKRLSIILYIFSISFGKAQCPQIYDYLGNPSANPQFINCSGGSYNLNFGASSSFGSYTINWGDASANSTGGSYAANTNISHLYAATINTFVITLTIPSASCTRTALVVMEQPVFAGLTVAGGASLACAPKTLTFNNASTFASATTTFTYDFGDGTPQVVYSYTNAGQQVTHTYQKGTVNCQTQVILMAKNYCSFGIPSNGIVNPLLVYDVDNATIAPDKFIRCWPDNSFTFNNTTTRNCLPQGNTFQRQEWWNFGNFWGLGHDSIINWKPWPPTTPHTVSYPSVGSYSIMLRDSNLCGIDTSIINVSIVNPPVAGVLSPTTSLCQNVPVTFTNTSAAGYFYLWNFGTGGGYTNLGSGNKIFTYANPGTYTVKVVAFIPGSGSFCTDTANTVVTINASPVADFSLTPSVGCSSITNATFTNLSTNAVAWNWTFANGNTSTLQVVPPQTYTLVGSFTASLVVTASTSCANTKTASIIVRPTPVPIFPSFSSCVGSIANFTNNSTVTGTNAINSYTWNFGDGTSNSNLQSPAHTYTAPSTYTVKLIVATSFCKDSITHPISINIKPTANFAFTPTISCPPFPLTFSNTSTNATNTFWNFGTTPTSTSNVLSPNFTYTNGSQSFQIYTVTLISSTGSGCSDTLKKTLSVRPRPVSSFTPNLVGNGCSPVPATFSNSTIGATTYSWNFGDGFSSTVLNPNHTFTNSTLVLQTMTISLVATNSVGCSDTTIHTLQIFPKPFTSFTMIPANGCTPLLISFPSVPGVVSYTWNYGDGTPTVVANAPTTHIFTNTTLSNQTYTVTLIAQNGFGCTDSNFGYALIYPKPIANFVFTSTVGCSPYNAIIANTSTLSNSNLWKFGDGTTANTTNANHTYTNTSATSDQTYSCTLVTTSFHGCKDSVSKSILIHYKPKAIFALDTPKCASPIISFTNNSIGATSYIWDFGDSSPTSTALSSSHAYTNTGINNTNYIVRLVAVSPFACKDTAFGFPIVYAKPIPNFAITPSVGCSPLTTTMVSSSTNAHNVKWKFGDGNTSIQGGEVHSYTNTSSSSNLTVNCTLIAYNNNGCRDSTSLPLLVQYKPKASFTADTPACSPKIITFLNTSLGGASYNWKFGDGAVSTASAPSHQYSSTLFNQVFNVVLRATSTDNCTDSIKAPITIYPKPNFIISSAPDSGCTVLNVKFNSINGVSQYQWKFGDGNGSSESKTSNSFINNGTTLKTFTVQLFGKDIHGCSDTPFKLIKVYPKPTAKFSANPLTVYVPNQSTQFTNLSTSAASYTWSFGDGASSLEYSPSHAYAKAGEYDIRLIVTNNRGCKDTFNLPEKVVALDETVIVIPNAFKPNANGSPGSTFNDDIDKNNYIFHPNVKGTEKYQFSIYSRWGELLFDTKNPEEGWDGYYKGRLCTQDVYIWKVVATFLDGKSYNKSGDVLLLR